MYLRFHGLPPPSTFNCFFENHREWRHAQLIPMNGGNLRMVCPYSLWLEYWRLVSVGPTLPAVYKFKNNVGVNPMVDGQMGLVAAEYPGADTEAGPLEFTQLPPRLPQYYSAHSLSLPGYPQPVDFGFIPPTLPDYQSARPEAWHDLASHEKGCVDARDRYIANVHKRLEKEQRRLEKERRRRARERAYMDTMCEQFGHLMQGYPRPLDSSSSSSDHSAGGAYDEAGPSQTYYTQHLDEDE